MNGLKRNIPVPESMPKAYQLLLKKERLQKPALTTKRLEILQAQQRTNYKNEYDRISGIIEGYADRFARPGGGHDKQILLNRQNDLKKLFRQSHNHDEHPINGKDVQTMRTPVRTPASSSYIVFRMNLENIYIIINLNYYIYEKCNIRFKKERNV